MAHGPAGHLLLPLHPPAAVGGAAFRYYRWRITARRALGSLNVQASEFQMLVGGVRQVATTVNGLSSGSGENAFQLNDNSTATKYNVGDLDYLDHVDVDFDYGSSIAADGYRWYTANDSNLAYDPVSWEVYSSSDGSTWTLIDGRAQYATTSSRTTLVGTFTFNGVTVPTIRFWRWTMTKWRATVYGAQVSEFAMTDGGTRVPALGTGLTVDGVGTPGSETPDKIHDNNVSTKWFGLVASQTDPRPFVFDYGYDGVTADAYWWYTGNDEPDRDPVSWQLHSSPDGLTWTLVDTQTDYAVTSSRSTQVGPFSIGGGGDATATPAVIARSVAIPAPTPQAGTVKSAPLIARSAAIAQATPQASKTVAPALIARTATVPAPTPQAGSTVTPAATTLTLTIPAASASGATTGTATPAVIPLAVTIPAASASGASGGTAAPTVIPLTVTLPAPTATGGGTTSPTVIPLTVTIPQASATGSSVGTATPAAITTTVAMPAPTNVYGSRADPARIQLAVTMPLVAASGSRTIAPAVIPLTVNVRTASATGGTQAIASPNVIATVTAIPGPTLVYGYIANPQAIALAVSIGAVLASGIVPDANPITVTLRDAGHTITVRTTGTTTTARENA